LSLKNTNLYNIGVSYKKADSHTRSKYSLSEDQQLKLLLYAKQEGIDGVFVLSTCNRTEITGFSEHPFQLINLLCQFSGGSIDDFANVSNIYKNDEAISHLFKIATGLESQILGDYEIVGQLKKSVKTARECDTLNPHLERLFNLVFEASKKVKNHTLLSSGTTSVSYAAVQFLIKNLSDLNNKKILVYGLGKMGKHTCLNLLKYTGNKSITLINRTESKVDVFVENYNSIKKEVVDNLTKEIFQSDVLIVSTGSSKPTVTLDNLKLKKPIMILDLSIPENVDVSVSKLDNVTLVNIDELSKVTDKTLQKRKEEIPKAEAIIKDYFHEYKSWVHNRQFIPAINLLKETLENIKLDEINFQKKKIKDFNVDQAEIVSDRIIQKITTRFVQHLKSNVNITEDSIDLISKVFKA